MTIDSWSRKKYLVLDPPTEEDNCPDQERILRSLRPEFGQIALELPVLRKMSALCQEADWKITASLSWDGQTWHLVNLEKGDTTKHHYGICVDLGSTTLALEIIHMDTGEVLYQTSGLNRQTAYGEDILTRIFYCKDQPEHLEILRQETVKSFLDLFQLAEQKTGISVSRDCISMVVSGNTTMTHFLYGLDPFPVFAAPYAVRTLSPQIYRGEELGFPLKGYVYSYPSKANYLGGDILSGLIATEIPFQQELSVFLDIGTNGELVIGNREFLISGAGAAGPALEGGVVKTGMRAEPGAVDRVEISQGEIHLHVLGEESPKGICGSGIVDLIAQMFLEGWLDIRGKLQEGSTPLICAQEEGELAMEYAPGLFFYQSDIDEFLKTKAAANTMVEYLLLQLGLPLTDIEKFYVAGAFGTHITKEAGVTVGLYPDIPRDQLILPGNTSLIGARKMLLHRNYQEQIDGILEKMEYVQFGAVEDFLQIMIAATAIPHTDYHRYPSVMAQLSKRGRPLE